MHVGFINFVPDVILRRMVSIQLTILEEYQEMAMIVWNVPLNVEPALTAMLQQQLASCRIMSWSQRRT
jgi:hypothetical protein